MHITLHKSLQLLKKVHIIFSLLISTQRLRQIKELTLKWKEVVKFEFTHTFSFTLECMFLKCWNLSSALVAHTYNPS
jgi:hypothetical protein